MPRPKASPAEVASRCQRIVAGARHCFALYGFDGITVEHLEQHCGYTRGTVFRYYASKAELLTAVVAAEEIAQQPQYEAIFAAAASGSPQDVLAAALRLQLRRIAADPVPTRLRIELLVLGQRDHRWALRIRKLEQQQRQWRRGLVARAFANSPVKSAAKIELLTDVISTLVFGLAAMRALEAPMPSSDVQLVKLLTMMTEPLITQLADA